MTDTSSTTRQPVEYRFDGFHLVPATRELWRRGERRHVQPLAFDCLVYLLEHRRRVVGRDELASAVWAKVDVGDQQIRQLVLRARQAVDDDAKEQRVIRTVSGGGYRWVAGVETTALQIEQGSATAPLVDPSVSVSASTEPPAEIVEARHTEIFAASANPGVPPRRGRWKNHAILAGGLLGFAALLLHPYLRRKVSTPPAPASIVTRQAVVVLPLEVTAPPEAGWVRLGAMDLIAQRMRGAGLPVPPSDSVVSAVYAVGEPGDAGNLAKLRETLGAATVVQGSAVRSAAGWKVGLSATGADDAWHAVEIERPEVVDAARQATDMLLAALGRSPAPESEDGHDDLQILLQRAKAALLAGQLDTARSILLGAPESAQRNPRLRVVLAQIEQRAGRPDQAQAALTALLGDPALAAEPSTHASALTTLGFIAMDRNDCAGAERNFDAAVSALTDRREGFEAGNALSARGAARACLSRVDEAIGDLSAAGPILEAAGDRLGLANLDNRFALLEMYRRRPAEAVPYLQSASAIHQSFGAINGFVADLSLLCMAQTELLRWTDALATSERLWALSTQVGDADRVYAIAGMRANVLIGTGQYREAAELLRGTEAAQPDGHGALTLTFRQAKARLAWDLGEAKQALAEADAALSLLPPAQMSDEEDLDTVLLRQRASIALGQPSREGTDLLSRQGGLAEVSRSPALLVAQAEWAVHEGRAEEAEGYFHRALAAAEAHAVPASVVLAVDAYVRWLLARQRPQEARDVAGRVTQWADRDYDSALLQAAVFHALAQTEAWSRALKRAQVLAGERAAPAALLQAPVP